MQLRLRLAWTLLPCLLVAGLAQERSEEAEFEQIVQLLQLTGQSRVADVGAGGGLWTRRLATHVAHGAVIATEVRTVNVEGLRAMARREGWSHVSVVLGDQERTGLPQRCCDAILLRLVYHAFDQPEAMRDGLLDALVPGGVILVIDFRPAADVLALQMQESGFELIETIDSWQGQEGVFAQLFRKPHE